MSCRPVVPLSFTRHGDASRPAVILLQGLGMASNAWPAELVDALVETGLQVVLPDNRDAGKKPARDGRARQGCRGARRCGENARAQEGFGCLRS